jgi:hypothetical protein
MKSYRASTNTDHRSASAPKGREGVLRRRLRQREREETGVEAKEGVEKKET